MPRHGVHQLLPQALGLGAGDPAHDASWEAFGYDAPRTGSRHAEAVEVIARLCADRDPHPALFTLLVRALTALETARRPARVAVCFGLRAVDLLGHRPRLDGSG